MHGVGPVGRSVCVRSVIVDQPLLTGALDDAMLRHIGVEDLVVDPEQPCRKRSRRITSKVPREGSVRRTDWRKCTEGLWNRRCIGREPGLSVYHVKPHYDVSDVDVCQKSRRRYVSSAVAGGVVDIHDPGICEIQK